MLNSIIGYALYLISISSNPDIGELRFGLLTAEKPPSKARTHIELPYERTPIHFALFHIQKEQNHYIQCLTEPDSFNTGKSRTTMQLPSGVYSIVAVPTLAACQSARWPEEKTEHFSFSLRTNESVEVLCKAEKSPQTFCRSTSHPTIERLR